LSAQEKRAERMALNAIGKVYFEEQSYEQSAAFFKSALDLNGLQKGTAYLENLTLARIRQGSFQVALAELEQHPEYVDSQPALAADQAFLQGQLGQTDLALTNYAKLFATGYHSADSFKDYIVLLTKTQQIKKASDEVNSYLQTEDSPQIRLLQADLLKLSKKYNDAITLLQEQHEKYPYDVGISLSLGDAFIKAGKPSEALSLSEEMLKQDGDLAATWFLKGRAQFALKWYREARESFNMVIAQSPSNTDAREFLAALSGILGEGSTAAADTLIEPVAVPDVLTNSLPDPPDKFGLDEGAYYSRHITAVSFKKGEELKRTEYLKAHIISSTGVSAFSTYQVDFNPLNEEIYVNQLTVRNAAGGVVSTGSVDNYYILDDRSSSAASSKKVLNIPVAGLQPGFNIELTLTRRELGRPKEFTFLPCLFAGAFPIQEQDLYYFGDTNAVRFKSPPGLEARELAGGLLWCKNQPPVFRVEPLQPALMDYLPVVWVSDASANWSDLVANYLATIRDRLQLPDDQKQLARQLTANTPNLKQKIAALADYIQTNYTYNAIEFGSHARIPQSLSDFVRNKYGDCKDHAVLAQQMLQAVGIRAYLALVNTTEPIQKDLPSLDQFDHMVVYIPSAGENGFLDCTAKTFDIPSERYALADREALILDPAKPYFQKVPSYPTNASVVTVTRTIVITNQVDALVTEELKIDGTHAGIFRAYFRGLAANLRREYVVDQFVGPSAELKNYGIDGMEDPHSPLTLNLTYLVHRQFQVLDNEVAGNPPLNFERLFLLRQNVEKRTTPFEVPIPLAIRGSVIIRVPANFKADPPEVSKNIGNQFVSCQFSATTANSGWRLDYRIYEPSHRFAPEQYSAYNLAMQQVVNTLGPDLVCIRQGNNFTRLP
jgi:transglutaminase-like putative cysteine protease/thioredoxin-like negative regulator of GroEL